MHHGPTDPDERAARLYDVTAARAGRAVLAGYGARLGDVRDALRRARALRARGGRCGPRGAHATVVASTLAYALAAAVLLAVPWPGWLAALLPLPYAVNAAAFWSVRDEDCERANRGWRRFLWLNLVTGFLVTMLLIAVART